MDFVIARVSQSPERSERGEMKQSQKASNVYMLKED